MTSHPCAARPRKGSSKNNKNMALNGTTTAIATPKSEVLIREYDQERDLEAIEKLERSCEIGTGKGFAIVTNMMGDPLCRIRLFPLHIMLELVGVARGCVKRVFTGVSTNTTTVLAGYILGLRVSPSHRRKGIGSTLVNSLESWASRHGARHVVAAADAANAASRALFSPRRGIEVLSLPTTARRRRMTWPCIGGGGSAECGEFGFVMAYGIDGEGGEAEVRRLVRALWGHAGGEARRGEGGEWCKAMVVEAEEGDAVARHVLRGGRRRRRRAWRVDDVWMVKSWGGGRDGAAVAATARRRFVDPKDF
uniref:N-acetyltransferase domain-containing protein n=1 Tax=Leersia perrieri TaxID=77586 RepID=A0A0D9Y0D3_9ORYZ